MIWTHPSLDRPADYEITNGRVLKGRMIIAYAYPTRGAGFRLLAPDGRFIGRSTSKAEAMLMAIRDHEGGRRV